jgi:hypothetical protein
MAKKAPAIDRKMVVRTIGFAEKKTARIAKIEHIMAIPV